MSRVILLDAGVIGLVTNPKQSPESTACTRELLRANKVKGIARLDELAKLVDYLPITTTAMRQAAMFWAQARQQEQPTAGDKTIDSDMILAAQATTLGVMDVVITTTNVGHLSSVCSSRFMAKHHD